MDTPSADAAAASAGGVPAPAPADDGSASLEGTSVSGSGTSSRDREAECWICREDGRGEKLIRPCLCRGSMSGVHRSCVESWIASQLETGDGGTAPRCPVCHQEYRGDTEQPGIVAFMRSVVKDVARQVLRCVSLIVVLSGYWIAAQEDWNWLEVWMRVLLFFFTGALFISKLVALLLSIPLQEGPQTGWRRLVVTTASLELGGMLGEAIASTAIVALWCICGMIRFRYLLPFLVFAAIVLGRILAVYGSYSCLANVALSAPSPLILEAFHMVKDMALSPCWLLSPTDVFVHATVAMAALLIFFICPTEDPLLLLFTAHSVVLVAGIIENAFVRRARWKAGKRWLALMQFAMSVSYCANLLREILPGAGAIPFSWRLFGCSTVWLVLIIVLSISVNRGGAMEYYSTWQQHHGRFQLGPSPEGRRRARRNAAAKERRPAQPPAGPLSPTAEGEPAQDAASRGGAAVAEDGVAAAADLPTGGTTATEVH